MSKVIHLNEKNFDETVSSSKPVLVDFWAPWCGPCKMLGPTIDALAEEVDDSVGVAKVNVDESPDLAQRFGISAIPKTTPPLRLIFLYLCCFAATIVADFCL